MATTAAIASAIIGGVSAIDASSKGRRAEKNQQKAQDDAMRINSQQEKRAEEEMNRMNMKKPDIAAMRAKNAMATGSKTMLTSPTGTGDVTLGKTTLLGG